ncbi:hypothetical protein BJ138DRAFT_1119262 [Hygrophoropsis aurantiaca]|uniref:Uncharacterized protein n=1 Tax=Hygrophoropsis aurantiaca TaxID=72124 RepID=A0ACB7ZW78_9AGAM|nr:hypothetical protein BJ138DRAFT_1119262 [Hygrophoropsis aurantiaca]
MPKEQSSTKKLWKGTKTSASSSINWVNGQERGLAAKCKPITSPTSRTTRLVSTNTETKESEEAVFTLQGVLVDMDLPPLNALPRPNQLRHIRQSITISGLGESSFGDAVTSLYILHTELARQVRAGALEKWRPSDFKGFVSLDIHNRYYTLRKFADGAEKVPFDKLTDPRGFLEDNNGQDLIHTDDNQVDFYSSASSGAQTAAPSSFRVGDIVEVCLSVAMTPVSYEKYKMVLVLRSLAQIECTLTMDAETKRNVAQYSTIPQHESKLLKRRRAYSLDAESGSPRNGNEASSAGQGNNAAATEPQSQKRRGPAAMVIEDDHHNNG